MNRAAVHASAAISTTLIVFGLLLNISIATGLTTNEAVQAVLRPYALVGSLMSGVVILVAPIICAVDAYQRRLGWWLVGLILGSLLAVTGYYWLSYRPMLERERLLAEINASGSLRLPPLTSQQRGT